jgi:PKD repeat protein
MTYRTDSAPKEIKTGYFILTATAATPRNLGMITGYSLFYEEGKPASDAAAAQTSASGSSNSGLASSPSPSTTTTATSTPLPAAIRQVFDSFELIAAPAQPLTVEITSSDTEGVAPASFEFEADVTGGMEPHTISWDFDDGSGESDDDDETPDHTFDQAGNYTVTATVTDSSGRTVSDSILITVEPPPPPPPLTRVNIISNDTEGVAPASFEFRARVVGGIEPYTYSWDFGDGSGESNERIVVHTFDQAGTYVVTVMVTDSSGRTVSDSILIIVR